MKVALNGGSVPTHAGTLNAGENFFYSAVIDATGGYAYFGTGTGPGKVVKVAFNILVNATDPTAAVQAIVWEARKRERRARREGAAPPAIVREILGPEPYPQARDLVTDIQRKHSAIAHRFASGAGLALMRRDSDMAEAVLLRLGARGIVALPVHDSFLVAEKHKSALQEVMDDELRKSTGDLW